nr:zinc finger protein with KRAB and SCAN domains 7-like [Dermacentor andersoni]
MHEDETLAESYRFGEKENLDGCLCQNNTCQCCGDTFGDEVQLITHLMTHRISDDALHYQENTQHTPTTDESCNVDDLATVAAPMYDLLKKDTTWVWTDACSRSFAEAKQRLIDSQRVHVDFAMKDGYNLFLLVDSYSKWIEAKCLRTTTTSKTIDCLKEIFAAYGYPEELISDNGPQFTAQEFADFTSSHGIRHTRVTDNDSTSFQTRGSIRSIDKAMLRITRPGREEASATLKATPRMLLEPERGKSESCAVSVAMFRADGMPYTGAPRNTDDTVHICKSCHQSSVKMSKFVERCRNRTGKKHKCETCGKQFHRADHLTEHYRTHTDERPYKCKTCDKSFGQSHLDNLNISARMPTREITNAKYVIHHSKANII